MDTPHPLCRIHSKQLDTASPSKNAAALELNPIKDLIVHNSLMVLSLFFSFLSAQSRSRCCYYYYTFFFSNENICYDDDDGDAHGVNFHQRTLRFSFLDVLLLRLVMYIVLQRHFSHRHLIKQLVSLHSFCILLYVRSKYFGV